MTQFDKIYEIAADNYGIVTFAEAREAGVTGGELSRFVDSGRLEKAGRGIYRLAKYIPTHFDQYALAVALVGSGSYIHGESVLAMHDLALVNPMKTNVAVVRRTRKSLPEWISLAVADKGEVPIVYEGIPSQSVGDAIRYCRKSVMKERLIDAIHAAVREGLISQAAGIALRKELDK